MNKRIFIVEDDDGIMEAMQLILMEEGYEIGFTQDGSEALDLIKKFKPQLIFLDLLMSGTDGRQICAQLKKDKKTKDMKVVMISAHVSAKESAKKFHADGFLAKPFSVDDLLSTAEKFTS